MDGQTDGQTDVVDPLLDLLSIDSIKKIVDFFYKVFLLGMVINGIVDNVA